jgi:hypothetical protein
LKWHLRWWRISCFNLKRRGGDHTVSRAWFGAEVGKRRGQQKHIFFFFVTSPLISRLEKKKTKDPHLRMAAIILFTASIPAPIDPRVTGKSLNQ